MIKYEFLQDILDIKEVSFATSRDNKPSNRIIDMMYQEDDRLFFLTARGKKIYKDIKYNPYVAISTFKNLKSYTLSGKVKNESKSYLKILFDRNPFMNELYPGNTKDILEVFSITDWTGEYMDISTRPVNRKSFKHADNVHKKGQYTIIKEKCNQCDKCIPVCPTNCIDTSNKQINQVHCLRCGACIEVCPQDAIEVI